MGRSRYKPIAPHPHFITCTVVHWLMLFSQPELVAILLSSLEYVDEPCHWRYSSARNYTGQLGILDVEVLEI